MDGLLVIDKPRGITSHDVVAAVRRALRLERVGHTGTLDPLATGVLPLAIGRATRLSQFLTASDKDYDAEILLGVATDTYDVTGREISRVEAAPSADAVTSALATLSGEYLQAPPPFSAKRIGGRRAYDLARAERPVQPSPVPVSVSRLTLVALNGPVASVSLTCSAGFYVRSLAQALGERLGTGACLQALRRTRSGEFTLAQSIPLDVAVTNGGEAAARMIPLERLLPRFPSVVLTAEGEARVAHGRDVGPPHVAEPTAGRAPWVRLLDGRGALVALGEPGETPGSLHPSVVLI